MTAGAAAAPAPSPAAYGTAGGLTAGEKVLDVRGLSVRIGRLALLHDVTFSIAAGERVGLIGESGSGKSLTSLALMGLLPEQAEVRGSIRLLGFEGDLVGAREGRLARSRGRDIAMVFQEPMTALNPTMRVGDQVSEALTVHGTTHGRHAVRARVVELLGQVGLRLPAETARAFPHQLSGGQRQRVVVAIALANDPGLLVCDEPTTALDVTVQATVLDLIVEGVESRGAAMLFITHDLSVVATVCERVLVMYGGRIVEAGAVRDVFTGPRHRYTQGLLAASDLDLVDADGRLRTISGSVPSAGAFPDGCVFRNRCPHATEVCAQPPAWEGPDREHGFACHHPAGAAT